METGPGREDEKEHAIQRLVGHSRMETGMQYRARRYGYSAPEDKYEPAKLLTQPFTDRYRQAVQEKRSGTGRPRRP